MYCHAFFVESRNALIYCSLFDLIFFKSGISLNANKTIVLFCFAKFIENCLYSLTTSNMFIMTSI